MVKKQENKVSKVSRPTPIASYNKIRTTIYREKADLYKDLGYNDKQFLNYVSEVYNSLRGQKLDKDSILESHKKLRKELKENKGKRKKPYIPPFIQNPQNYYEIIDFNFDLIPEYVYIDGTQISKKLKEYRASKLQGKSDNYDKFFKSYVKYFNILHREASVMESGSVFGCYRFSEPYEKNNKWHIDIILCNPEGIPNTFGYSPDKHEVTHDIIQQIEEERYNEREWDEDRRGLTEEEAEKEKKRIDKEEKQLSKEEKELIKKKIEAEEEKIKTEKAKREETKKSGLQERLIKEKDSITKDIKLFKDVGEKEEVKASIKRIKEINKKLAEMNK